MIYYWRQALVYGNPHVPTHELHLIALFFLIMVLASALLSAGLLYQKDVELKKFGLAFGLISVFGMATILYNIA